MDQEDTQKYNIQKGIWGHNKALFMPETSHDKKQFPLYTRLHQKFKSHNHSSQETKIFQIDSIECSPVPFLPDGPKNGVVPFELISFPLPYSISQTMLN